MATVIHGLTPAQSEMLKHAFGYESYPNGNHGHMPQAVAWVQARFGGKFTYGNPRVCSELILGKRIYFTNSQIRDLKMRSLERNKIYFEDWRFNHAITLLAEKPNSVDRWDAILRKITMVWDRIALLKEVNMLEDIERLEAHLEQLKRALVA